MLKTLKDIEPCGTCNVEHSCYCPEYDKGVHENDCEILNWCLHEDIKQEAIKWVKYLMNRNKWKGMPQMTEASAMFIHFFNIKEEELKHDKKLETNREK